MYSITLWQSLFSKKPAYEKSWSLETLASALSKPRIRPDDKKKLPLWAPSRLVAPEQRQISPSGGYRLKANVESLSCLVLDYDEGETIDHAKEVWQKYTFILYTSYNHTKKHHKFRVVLPLASPVLAKNWPGVWGWAQVFSGLKIDEKCKDPLRIYYLPCIGDDSNFLLHEAKMLDLSHVRYDPPKYRTPPIVAGAIPTENPAWREAIGIQAGGRRVSDRIRDIVCPQCGRKEVWWLINPTTWTGAACNRRNSCGWAGSILQTIGVNSVSR